MSEQDEAYRAALERLEGRRRVFVEQYLIDRNATRAAIRAGYAAGSAHVTGSRLLSDAKVAAAVALGTQAVSAVAVITAERVMQELARIAFFDIRNLAGLGSGTLALLDLDDDTAAALAEVRFGKDGEMVVKANPKLPALEKIGRQLGMWRDEPLEPGDLVIKVLRFTGKTGEGEGEGEDG